MIKVVSTILLLSCLGACSDDPEPPPPPVGEWISALSGAWSLGAGEEKYICVRATLAHPLHVARFRPQASAGTHHTMLTMADDTAPDGVSDCDGYDNGQVALFASGYGTEDLALPDGIAVEVPAGTQLLLNVHLLNTTDQPLDGSTGTDVLLLAEPDVESRAEVVLAGKVDGLEVVPGSSTQTGTCTFTGASTVHAVMPHMHERGSHFRLVAEDTVVLDEPFAVQDQHYRVLDPPVELAAGDRIEVECSYENPSSNTYGFGPLAGDEMCYGIFFRYPALGGGALCTE